MKLTGFSAPRHCESCQPAEPRRAGRAERRAEPRSVAKAEPRSVAKAETRITRESSALKLTLQTAEGDTVEISLEAQSLRQSERSSARGPGGRISQKSDTRSNSLTASVNVEGELSEAELEDIQGLLQSLAGGGTPPAGEGDLDTVSGYQYSYQHTREVSRSQVEIYG